jgi:arylformamidase
MDPIDITRPLSTSTAVWPGDRRVEWSWTMQIEAGSSVNVGALSTSTHAATHADAPLHVESGGAAIDELSLRAFAGPVDVVEVTGEAVTPADVDDLAAPRVLFRTPCSNLSPEDWPEAVVPILPEAVDRCASQGVMLVGTDAPSVDPLDSTSLDAHHALIRHGIVNLEGLDLSGVTPGSYTLVALPLKIEGADAAPVRAALFDPGRL